MYQKEVFFLLFAKQKKPLALLAVLALSASMLFAGCGSQQQQQAAGEFISCSYTGKTFLCLTDKLSKFD